MLTLGETTFLLGQGLTVLGKPLKDHEEWAIDLIYDFLQEGHSLKRIDLS